MQEYVLWYQELGMHDVGRVGGKNASLGEMISNLANAGVQVPGGFATTAEAFNEFLEQSGLEARIHDVLDSLDVDDVNALTEAGKNKKSKLRLSHYRVMQVKKRHLQCVHQPRLKICLMRLSQVNKRLS